MKLRASLVLAILFPAFSIAGVAGDWAGVLTFGQQSFHFVLHVTGPDAALKATHDSPDQRAFGIPVPSIALSSSTLQFSIPLTDVKFSGLLYPDGSIVGTFIQHGTGVPLVLERTVTAPRVIPALTQPAGALENGRYHHNLTGVEFDLPSGWSIGRTGPRDGDPAEMTVLVDPDGKAIFASVDMAKVDTPPGNITAALSRAVPMLVARRAGQTGAVAPHLAQGYKIREGSVEQTSIGGHQAVRAIGEFEQGGKQIVELLTWIYTEHTRAYFFAKMASENLPAVQSPFEQIIQSARIP